MDQSIMLFLLDVAIGLALAIVGYLLKRAIAEVDRKIQKNEEDVQTTAEEVKELKLNVAKEYVTKNDHNETTSQIMKKLDRIMDLIMELNKGRQ